MLQLVRLALVIAEALVQYRTCWRYGALSAPPSNRELLDYVKVVIRNRLPAIIAGTKFLFRELPIFARRHLALHVSTYATNASLSLTVLLLCGVKLAGETMGDGVFFVRARTVKLMWNS